MTVRMRVRMVVFKTMVMDIVVMMFSACVIGILGFVVSHNHKLFPALNRISNNWLLLIIQRGKEHSQPVLKIACFMAF